ncbi:MAG TPA: hypothetical protein DD766_09590 [Desulfovibrio sp.]|jgi:c-di-GMP-binding flagellar brake protein YcgR|nr:hypothetical protein [Desulfovibrio sp.]HBR07201.1 hypothetical protein [Desulfovibrio sp.]
MDGYPSERRQTPRIYLRAYAFNRQAEVRKGGKSHRLGLVDISMGGARLSVAQGGADTLFSVGDTVICSIPGVADGGQLQNLSCQVRWVDAAQLGLQFLSAIPLSTAQLQQLFSR